MLKKILYTVTALLILASIYLVFFYAPIPIDPREAGGDPNNFKIFYFHVPIAITAYLAFASVFVSSILYLRSKQQKWDIVAISAAEVGIVFAFLTLVSGSIWARSAWGEYWVTWDVRLNTSLVLFLIYLSYLMVRQAVDEPEKRARLSAVFGIVGFIGVPLSFMSIRLWNRATIHPVAELNYSTFSPLLITFFMNFIAFFLLAASLILLKIDSEHLKEKTNELKRIKGL
ncbi:ABC-type transport system involved in cytochrome c biogenesis, permease component [Candidatus Methanoperedens nitroreducens]|uniref:ABC-type transport system involved in cytochrome c biogenesis, permease component n=1 Tax=Candidatus Methanoperedens nitratireducens TaxID=1392998 RepID=A0A062V4V3_9EURY|nr:cytochrome c biogenesis protein [Candidatus Methanoperedens nitroreducens]KCZ70410.1 ABC-type transport system involved in cytochrome c biogenesis, permease component [Candidatus Methanoperedens nitroreducens]MDJ1420848.1 cytochrome c biogenesis protein [Candidatus Methanoperedens sp.]